MNWKMDVTCDEEKIRQTIARSTEALYERELAAPLSPFAFLVAQGHYIQKRWWMLQGALLGLLLFLLIYSESDWYVQRCLGIAAPLFAILALPEFWKNRNHDAMEVEGVTFYTLRQVYAARLTLFGGTDLLLMSLFFLGASVMGRITLWEMLIQFLLPFNVSCCICFQCLYSHRAGSEVLSIALCAVWTALWVQIVLYDTIYNAISVPLWLGMLTLSIGFLGYSLVHGQRKLGQTWEVRPIWN